MEQVAFPVTKTKRRGAPSLPSFSTETNTCETQPQMRKEAHEFKSKSLRRLPNQEAHRRLSNGSRATSESSKLLLRPNFMFRQLSRLGAFKTILVTNAHASLPCKGKCQTNPVNAKPHRITTYFESLKTSHVRAEPQSPATRRWPCP